MSTKDQAAKLHQSGCNCAQSVLMSVCDKLGLDENTAYSMAAFFGGGMRKGEVCGAATGALMALGLEHGDENNRQKNHSQEFMNAFRDQFGSYICRELIGQDGMKKKDLCPVLIGFAAEYLESELEENS